MSSEDERFLRVQKDPRFWEMPENQRKVTIDQRFRSMFTEQRFKVKYTVDKRGRPVHQTSSEDLRRFYQLSESEEDQEDQEGGGDFGVKVVDEDEEAGRSSEDEDSDSDSDSEPDLARGKGNVETSSDEDEDDVDAVLRREEEEIQHDWGELCKDAPRSEETSSRLAVCNMDWDRLKARDLLALLNSFTQNGGAVLSVKIFPSEFGKERLRAEETRGPPELKVLPEDSDEDTEEERVYREKMRDYQFKRLKYFYAVVECDSASTAAKIYQECDGYEYETSCSVLDLRFIPDGETFDEEPKDAATDVNLEAYAPKVFTSSANTTSKVQLTWDETDHERVTALSRRFDKNELLDMDFNAYLASSSEDEDEEQEAGGLGDPAEETQKPDPVAEVETKPGEEEEEEEETRQKKKKKKSEGKISKYRELLRGLQDKEKQEDKDMEMEVTWVPGLKETTEQLVKKKLQAKEALTPWEEFLQKKKEKKKHKKAQKKSGGGGEQLSDDELPPDVDLSDPFFSEETASADVKQKPKQKKKKKKEEVQPTEEEEEELNRQKAEMALLLEDDSEQQHFNYEQIVEQQNLSRRRRKQLQKAGQRPQDDHFQVDVKDPRFQAMFTSHLFNLDPSHPSFKKTRATDNILAEKRRRREEREEREEREGGAAQAPPPEAFSEAREATDPSLALLVKSIKSKTEQFQSRKKQKVQ